MRGEQSKFAPAKSKRDAMAPWRSRHGGMDGCAARSPARPCGCETERTRGDTRRNGWRYARRSEEPPGQVALFPEHSFGEGAARRFARIQNERQRSSTRTWFSGPRDRAGLVRDGVDQVVAAHHRYRPTVCRLLSND